MRVVLLLLIISQSVSLFAQQNTGVITGKVVNEKGEGLAGATIRLKESSVGSISDTYGAFRINDLPLGRYSISVSSIGYQTAEQVVQLKAGAVTELSFKLNVSTEQLNVVEVVGKTKTEQVRSQSYAVAAIDAQALHNSATDIGQVLNRTAGVRVREDGGLGSNFNFSLNGFSGRQVKFFLDGIPMDNFGSSLTLNNLPINMAERLEVYKGVVPVWLGSDALGGAINIVTNQGNRDFLDASYSIGSFNTHRSSISGGFTNKRTGITAQANIFQNYSDNNYWVKVQISDLTTGKYSDYQKVRRFHDTYKSETMQFETGIANKRFADKFLLGIILSQNKKDIQTAALMETVYGKRFQTSNTVMPTVKYKKDDLFFKGLNLSLYGGYNLGETQNVDTVARTYNWSGDYKVKPDPTAGEESKTLYKFRNNLAIATANLSYTISPSQSISFNYVYNSFNRKGNDILRPYEDSYKRPQMLAKNVFGLGYKFDFKNKWSTTIFLKQFILEGTTSRRVGQYTSNEHFENVKSHFSKGGWGIATSYYILPSLQIKGSYENTYRLPEGEEMFGDGVNLSSNNELKPEKSANINVGLLFGKTFNNHKLSLETSFLYRDAEDFIRQEVTGAKTKFVNLRDVRNTGFEGEIRYSYNQLFHLSVNGTYQNLVNTTKYEKEGDVNVSNVYLDKMPNIPYLFGNADLGFSFRKIGFSHAALSVGYSLNYVHEYYLRWPSHGFRELKDVIPQQVLHSVYATYKLKDGRYNVTLECRNLADSELYDNFRLQKPGRSFSAKLRYFISN